MKKALALTALALTCAAPAFAQSSVTVYGRLNVSAEAQKTGNVSDDQMVDNASRIGFKGTEDLGGGMKAKFLIEHGFDATTGTQSGKAFWGRESWVGLAGNFGEIRLGNMAASDAYFAVADYISMHNHDTGTSSDALWGYVSTGALKNAVAYYSPTFGGFNASGEIGEAVGGDRPMAVAANYDAGPLHLGGGYEKFGDDKSASVRGLYELGQLTLGAYVGKQGGTVSRNFWRVSGMYVIGAGEVHLNIGGTGNANSVSNTGAMQYTVAYNYNLSKRTKVYTFYTKVNNKSGATYMTGTPGVDFGSLAVGIRHNF